MNFNNIFWQVVNTYLLITLPTAMLTMLWQMMGRVPDWCTGLTRTCTRRCWPYRSWYTPPVSTSPRPDTSTPAYSPASVNSCTSTHSSILRVSSLHLYILVSQTLWSVKPNLPSFVELFLKTFPHQTMSLFFKFT